MIKRSLRWQLPVAVLSCIILVLSACGSDGGSDNPIDGNGDNDVAVLLTTEQLTILSDAEDSFDELVLTETHETARQTLVEQLNSTDGVKTAALLEDGSTVWVVFDDGMNGVVSTIDLDAMNAGAADIDYDALKAISPEHTLKPAAMAKPTQTTGDITPGSKNVLILNISEPTQSSANNVNKLRGLLLDAGWTDDDITIKTRLDRYDNSIHPNDLFNLGEYGIVVIYAHGLYGTPPDSSVTNGHHYLQVCSDVSRADPMAPQFEQWANEGKLVLSEDLGVFMRNDLLLQQIQHMSDTIVFMCVCWGWNAQNAFVSNNSGAYFGWDDMVMAVDAHPWLYQSFKLLSQSSPVNTVVDTYNDSRVVKSSLNAFDRTAYLHMTPETGILQFPAWADITVNMSSLPAGTSHIAVSVEYESELVYDGALSSLEGGVIDGLMPGTLDITMTAGDGGAVLAQKTHSVTFHPGLNEITLDFNSQIAPATLYIHTWETGYDWGPFTTDFYIYYKWKRNPDPDSNIYYITYYDDGQHAGDSYRVELQPGGDYSSWESCVGPDYIVSVFGSNIFGIGDDELVSFRSGSHLGNHKKEKEDLEWIEEQRINTLQYIAGDYYEVFYDR